jgi:hypothetical protein
MTKERTEPGAITKRKPGPPCKLDDPELQDRFFDTLIETSDVEKACKKVGVSFRTLSKFTGREENREFNDELEATKHLLADHLILKSLHVIDDTSKDYFTNDRGKRFRITRP